MPLRKKLKKTVNKTAKKVAKAAGGKHLVEYAGTKIAKARAPKKLKKHIKSKSTGKQALGSAAMVALSSTGAGKGVHLAVKAATKASAKRTAAKKSARRRTAEQKESSTSKRLRLYEAKARKAAKLRAKKKKK